jgi:signal transduction histidine kinase
MKQIVTVLLCGLLCSLVLLGGCTQQPGTSAGSATATPQATYTSNETLVAFVDSAAAYVQANGKEKALAEFNNRNGSFFKGELYIYAYDFNGTTLAHPVNPEAVGKKREGANGVFVTEMSNLLKNGSVYYPLVYANPAHNQSLETKLCYAVKIDDTWWLGSGVYSGPVEPAVAAAADEPSTTQDLKNFVDNAAAYAQKNGKGAALSAFSNKTGPFVAGNVYIYALDYSGRALALPYQPQLVGTNFSGLQDTAGRYYTRTEIALAKEGGGYLLYQYPDPSDNFAVKYKVSYVRPVDDSYWVGAGVYTRDDLLANATLRQFVADAKAYAQKNGKENTLAEFNNVNGSFAKGDLYVFAYDYNGTVLAWPYHADQLGINRLNATDPMGAHHVQAMIAGARNGTALVDYYTVNPATNTTELKISYVTDVDGTWMLGAGRYMEPGPVVIRA